MQVGFGSFGFLIFIFITSSKVSSVNFGSIVCVEFSSISGMQQTVELVKFKSPLHLLDLLESLLMLFTSIFLLDFLLLVFFGIAVSNLDSWHLNEAGLIWFNFSSVKLEEVRALVYKSIELVVVLHPVLFHMFLCFLLRFSVILLHLN